MVMPSIEASSKLVLAASLVAAGSLEAKPAELSVSGVMIVDGVASLPASELVASELVASELVASELVASVEAVISELGAADADESLGESPKEVAGTLVTCSETCG
jgi:hypothetical protein